MSAGLIAANLSVAPSSLSFHLQQMTRAGVLQQRRCSRHIIYAVNEGVMSELRDFLALSGQGIVRLPSAIESAEQPSDIIG
jgi:ArsR family transcriptional regulator, arsenate/arsenite/antimonite-responsive transcriptional repressor